MVGSILIGVKFCGIPLQEGVRFECFGFSTGGPHCGVLLLQLGISPAQSLNQSYFVQMGQSYGGINFYLTKIWVYAIHQDGVYLVLLKSSMGSILEFYSSNSRFLQFKASDNQDSILRARLATVSKLESSPIFHAIEENPCLVGLWTIERRRLLYTKAWFSRVRPPPIGYRQSTFLKARVYKHGFCEENTPSPFQSPTPFSRPLTFLFYCCDWTPPATATTALPHSSSSFSSDWML